MKLGIIYNIFDGEELIGASIDCLFDHVDLIIIVYQTISNFGEEYNPLLNISELHGGKIEFLRYDPDLSLGAMTNERIKRNIGLEFAKVNHCTHFLHIDTDEFYDDFKSCKEIYRRSRHSGSVCRMHTYFKKPTLRFDRPEDYFVPFIHELRPDTITGNSSYKFWCDPTRTVNEQDVVELPIFMHHFSWCRKDIMRKMRNSSANMTDNRVLKNNLILEDYNSPELKEGFFVRNWNRHLVEVDDKFGLSTIL